MRVFIALVAIACAGLVSPITADTSVEPELGVNHVEVCQEDIMTELEESDLTSEEDIPMPEDIRELMSKIRQPESTESLSMAARGIEAAKFELPYNCSLYVRDITDFIDSDSCDEVYQDKELINQFWSSIKRDSLLDHILAPLAACVELQNANLDEMKEQLERVI